METKSEAFPRSDEHPPSLVGLIDTLANRVHVDPQLGARLLAVKEYLNQPEDVPRPFLSVLLRTQGLRIEPLKDALLCLAAQTDRDFEVIVLAHDVQRELLGDVRAIVDRLEPGFAERVTVIEVNGGTRSKPLNAGVDAAAGHFISVFDDDDLLFANWVETFHEAARVGGNKLLRAVVANQSVTSETWPLGQGGFRTTSRAMAEYPKTFDLLQHLLVNYSPFMSWAFPRSLFSTFGVRFDEELTVTEDWDVILRGSLLCGVDEVHALTSIYRRWQGGESSYTSHSLEEWSASESRVVDRLNDWVVMMPPGATAAMRRMVLYNTALDNYRFIFTGTSLRWPLNRMWDAVRPGLRLAVRVRNRLRRR